MRPGLTRRVRMVTNAVVLGAVVRGGMTWVVTPRWPARGGFPASSSGRGASSWSLARRRHALTTTTTTTTRSRGGGRRGGVPSLPVFSSSSSVARSATTTTTTATSKEFDVVVIGGGHAGCEAASAAARVGARTALVTQRVDTVGEMSCNPSIGGIGKGHLVREVDALGGLMGRAIDEGGIHFRMLNRRKGEAVWGPRAQADRDLYKTAVARMLFENDAEALLGGRLDVVEASAEDIVVDPHTGQVVGVKTCKKLGGVDVAEEEEPQEIVETLACRAVVITTGTFLRGRCWVGKESYEAGRHVREPSSSSSSSSSSRSSDDEEKKRPVVEPPSNALAAFLETTLRLPLGRLKTGTPPRLDGRTINWDDCDPQPSDPEPFAFSFLGERKPRDETMETKKREFVTCYRTNTNERTHEIVRAEASTLAPPSTDGVGPRYCPSIYKKVERFADRASHGVWLEPEGLHTDLVYPNGLSGAFPLRVQQRIVNSIRGLENAKIVQPGYDVEYDFVDPTSLGHDLGVRDAHDRPCRGVYLAGQICGTTGYEEAAALGLVAGANAARHSLNMSRFVLSRRDAYIGVLVDDLVTRGTQEPYRMFTSRAEYRLHLRADNADLRLTRLGFEHGLVSSDRLDRCEARRKAVDATLRRLDELRFPVGEWYARLPGLVPSSSSSPSDDDDLGVEKGMKREAANLRPKQKGQKWQRQTGRHKTATEILSMPHADLDAVLGAASHLVGDDAEPLRVPPDARDTVAAVCKYGAYLNQQDRDLEIYERNQQLYIPPDLDYSKATLPALSSEECEKLASARPKTFADASRISGVTPASLVYLYNHVTGRAGGRASKRPPRRSAVPAHAGAARHHHDHDDDADGPPLRPDPVRSFQRRETAAMQQ